MNVYVPSEGTPTSSECFVVECREVVSFVDNSFNLDFEIVLFDENGAPFKEALFLLDSEAVSMQIRGKEWKRVTSDKQFRLQECEDRLSFTECLEKLRKESPLLTSHDVHLAYTDLRGFRSMRWGRRESSSSTAGNIARCLVSPATKSLEVEIVVLQCTKDDSPFDVESWVCCGCHHASFSSLADTLKHAVADGCSASIDLGCEAEGKCYLCGRLHPDSGRLKDHVVAFHRETSSFFPCLACRMHFYTRGDLERHVASSVAHKRKARVAVGGLALATLRRCQNCDAEFASVSKLNRHMR